MQYALIELEDNTKVIIDALEFQHIMTSENEKVKTFEPDKNDLELKVVYGAFIPQPDVDRETSLEHMKMSKGYTLGYIHDNLCHLIELVDIEVFENKEGLKFKNYIPFVALINTDIEITNSEYQSISSFLIYEEMKPLDNVLNRYGVFSIKDQERRIKEEITKENWKSFIDGNRIINVANKIK